jgi:heptosyltransferase-1
LHTQSNFRLLVVRLGAMGDILHALPAVTALRQAHPRWVIDWVVEPGWMALLSARNGGGVPADRDPTQPLVDRVYCAAAKAWGREPLNPRTTHQISILRKDLRAGEYEAVLDLQGAVRSALIARVSGARRRIGESNPREWFARWLFTDRIDTRGAHVIEQDVELASAVAGDALTPVQPLLPVDHAAEAWCNALTAGSSKPMALLNPGAGWGAKRWPVERYAAVAFALAGRGFSVLVNAGPSEEAMAEEIRTQSAGAAIPVTCSVAQLIALTRRVALMVAGDTGPLHLACALGRPVVGIYGPTDPARNGPFGTRFKVLRSPYSLRNHARREAPESGLLTIQPEDVLAAIDEVLAPEVVHRPPEVVQ